MLARKVVTGLCFLLCFVPLLSQLCLHGNRCSLCVAFALGKSMLVGTFFFLLPTPPLFGIKGGGGGIPGADSRRPCGSLGQYSIQLGIPAAWLLPWPALHSLSSAS